METIDTNLPQAVDVGIIEDDAAILEVITECLSDQGLSVQAYPLGWLAHVAIRNSAPRVLIFDVRLPGVTGIQLFDLLRADPKTAGIPVIFLTADPEKVRDELPAYTEKGAVIVAKPFYVSEILELVTRMLVDIERATSADRQTASTPPEVK